jgi:uncharacterized membrane protein
MLPFEKNELNNLERRSLISLLLVVWIASLYAWHVEETQSFPTTWLMATLNALFLGNCIVTFARRRRRRSECEI